MRRTLALAIVVLLLLLLLATPSSARESWIKLNSKHFTIVGNSGESDMRKLAINLEQFRHVISLLFPKAQIEKGVPTTVFLFKSHDSFRPFKPEYKGKIRENVGGYFLSSADGNYIALTNQGLGREPQEVIFHEYEHFVVGNNLPNAPLWLNEGLAEYFSTFTASENNLQATVGAPIGRHIGTLREGRLLPFETLMKVNHKSAHYNETGKAGIFYAESWALVHYLMLSNDRKRQPQLEKFIAGLSAGMALEENFRQSFQADFGKIESELRSYVSKSAFPILKISFPEQIEFEKEMLKTTMAEAEVQYYLGDLLVRSRRLDDAEPYLKKSLELDPKFTMSQISLGILLMGQKRLAEAEKLLESVVANNPGNYLGHFHYANVLVQQERHEAAIKYYEQAIQLKPNLAAIHSALAYAYLSLGKEEIAAEAFKRATDLDPMNLGLYRSRSYVYLRLAQGSLAASDALTYIKRAGWENDHSSYMALAAYHGLRQAKQPTAASNVISQAATKLAAAEWPYPVIRYLLHQIMEAQVLAQAKDNDKLTEAHTYIGLDLSINGMHKEALHHLEWVRDNGNKNFVEYPLALSEIRRIAGK